MKRILAILLAGITMLALASCNIGEGGLVGDKAPKFNGEYVYNPPTDNYYIAWTYYDADGSGGEGKDIYARIGQGHTVAISDIGIYHASDETQKYYERAWEGEYSDWMVSPGYGYNEWKNDFDEFGPDLGSCNAMEDYFMPYFRAFGFDKIEGKMNEFYVGIEKICGVECWVFDTNNLNTIDFKFWIDPSNGVCLKVLDKDDGSYSIVTDYNLNYTSWTDNLAPASYDGIPG